jgi:hypothetical protein
MIMKRTLPWGRYTSSSVEARRASCVAGLAVLVLMSACGGGSTESSATASPGGCHPPTKDAYAKAVLADGPSAYYRLDETVGGTLCDASKVHNDGTYAVTGVALGHAGALKSSKDTALGADGSAKVAVSDTDSGISGSTSFTLEGWFQTTTRQDQMMVDIGQGGAQNMAGLGPWINLLSPTYVLTPGSGDYITFDTFDGTFEFDAKSVGIDLFDGRWHYAAISYSAPGGAATAYLDNHALGSKNVAEKPLASPVRIGFWVDTAYNKPFNGELYEIAVYPSALTAAQIARHFTAAG